MKKFSKIVYYIKLVLFIVNFYFIFIMLHNILDTKIYGLIFLIAYFIYSVKVVIELLGKKERYKQDFIYNFMQIGLFVYMLVVSIKCTAAKMYVTRFTISYFRINYIILSILIFFILMYNYIEFSSTKQKKKRK